jgi:predicted TIM-barrel fold metal-dependent hydrolase
VCQCAADIMWSPILRKFPTIKFALSEGGTGWVPYFLERIDRTYDLHHLWTGQDMQGKLPSDIFREHFLTCFIDDPVGVELRGRIGIDNVSWELDYPHADSAWPHAPEEVAAVLAAATEDEVAKITHGNAMRWYSFDPFTRRTREESTAGALRQSVAGHDVSIRSLDQGRHRHGRGIEIGELAKSSTA